MKRFITQALVALTILVGVLAVSVPAQPVAAAGIPCPVGKFCTYTGPNLTGNMYYYTPGASGTCTEIGAPFDNAISSYWNNYGAELHMYTGHGCNGLQWGRVPSSIQLYSISSPYDNAFSSIRWY